MFARGPVLLVACTVLAQGVGRAPPFPLRAPLGLPDPIPAPAENPLRPDVFALGRDLFFARILSQDRSVACATCHEPDHGFASREARPAGVAGRRALRTAPTLLNRAWGKAQRWDGAGATLEDQVLLPIADPNEMGLPVPRAVGRLAASEDWAGRFRAVFDAPPRPDLVARALACFVRGLVTGGSAVDRFRAGDRAALTPVERHGLWIYESKGGCWQCHSGPNLTDEGFHNTGVGSAAGRVPAGRFAVTGRKEDRGRFKTPTLRALARTAPYMHDGSLPTLAAVVAFYRRGGNANPYLDRRLKPVALSDAEAAALVAFLRALSGR